MHSGAIYGIVLALFFSIAAGLVGSFALMKRMLLASDVISHLALPGLGLAFLFRFNPLLGGAATLFVGTLLIWQLQKNTALATEAVVGVVFATSLAIGAALTPKEDLVEALFGQFQTLTVATFVLGAAAVLLIIFVILWFRGQLLLSLFSPELAAATSVHVNRLNLWFLLTFSLTVLVGLRFMGALLAGALIIVPATAGRRIAGNLPRFLVASCVMSVIATGAGFLITATALPRFSPGPVVVIISAVLFALTLLKKTPAATELSSFTQP